MIEINLELAMLIDTELKNKGIDRNIKLTNNSFCLFTKEQLSMIDSLCLNNFCSLDDLDKLPNLEMLEISSIERSKLSPYIEMDDSKLINHITDFSILPKLTKLKNLSILNDNYIKELDISQMKNLEQLVVIDNPHLRSLTGLDELKNLKLIVEYGNSIVTPLNIKQYMINTKDAMVNIMDLCRFPHIVDGIKSAENLVLQMRLKKVNIKFAEKTALYNSFVMEPKSAAAIYIKCLPIAYSLNNDNNSETIKKIYNYVVDANNFDYIGLKKRYDQFQKAGLDYQNVPFEEEKDFILLHSSYSAAIYNKSNCEGYVNFMRFLLSMVGIESNNVYCSVKDNIPIVGNVNHSILRIPIDGEYYYFDASIEKKGEDKFFMKTFDEISNTHSLGVVEAEESKRGCDKNERNITEVNSKKEYIKQ